MNVLGRDAGDFVIVEQLGDDGGDNSLVSEELESRHTYSRRQVTNITEGSSDNQAAPPRCLGTRHRFQENRQGVPIYGADIVVIHHVFGGRDNLGGHFCRAITSGHLQHFLERFTTGGLDDQTIGLVFEAETAVLDGRTPLQLICAGTRSCLPDWLLLEGNRGKPANHSANKLCCCPF